MPPLLWRFPKSQNPYNVKPFLTDISVMVAQIQKIQKTKCIFFEFCFWEDPLHPVIWSPTHSTSPQTLFFTDISVTVAQIQKIKKQSAFFFNFASGRTFPTQSTGPQPIQLVPKHCFFTVILQLHMQHRHSLQFTLKFFSLF